MKTYLDRKDSAWKIGKLSTHTHTPSPPPSAFPTRPRFEA